MHQEETDEQYYARKRDDRWQQFVERVGVRRGHPRQEDSVGGYLNQDYRPMYYDSFIRSERSAYYAFCEINPTEYWRFEFRDRDELGRRIRCSQCGQFGHHAHTLITGHKVCGHTRVIRKPEKPVEAGQMTIVIRPKSDPVDAAVKATLLLRPAAK